MPMNFEQAMLIDDDISKNSDTTNLKFNKKTDFSLEL